MAGVNYCFLAQAKVVYPGAPALAVLIDVYDPLPGQGKAHMTGLRDIRP